MKNTAEFLADPTAEFRNDPNQLKGELVLRHGLGQSWADIEIPSTALTLPLDQIAARYVIPALAAVLEQVRHHREGKR